MLRVRIVPPTHPVFGCLSRELLHLTSDYDMILKGSNFFIVISSVLCILFCSSLFRRVCSLKFRPNTGTSEQL